ncbi:MAG: glycosyltransferase family 39 protein, partial [Dehalococcoidia bacterium]|nr:glycosyltransferase family 39 protein [Dehalococcoidia bacterium]
LIAERGRIPDSYLPYSQLTSFTYHYGFHSLVAFFHWATGIEVVWSVVIVGQILSALVVAGAYFLAVTLTRNRWAGLIAGLVAGLLSPMPAYYVNWGRYTQLAGQTILPFAISLTVLAVEKARRRDIALAAIMVGGVMVSHFRVAAFYFAFAGVFLLYEAVRLRSHRSELVRRTLILLAISGGGAIVSLPWLLNQANHLITKYITYVTETPIIASDWLKEYSQLAGFDTYIGYQLLGIAALGLLMGVIWRRRAAVLITMWVTALFLTANPSWVGIPETGTINNFAVVIALYLPISTAVGFLVIAALEVFRAHAKNLQALVIVLVLFLGVWGAANGLSIRDSSYALVNESDLRAMAWIKENSPSQARFLVNAFPTGNRG